MEAEHFATALLARLPGERRAVGANNPFIAARADRVWLILRGRLDVSVVPLRDGVPVGTPRHVLSLGAGAVLFGMPPLTQEDGTVLALRATAPLDAELYEAPRAALEGQDFDLFAVDWIEGWVIALSAALAAGRAMPAHRVLEADPDQAVTAGENLTAPHGALLWLRMDSGAARYLGTADAGTALRPVTERSWINVTADGVCSGFLTPMALAQGQLWPALDDFHALLLPLLAAEREAEHAARTQRAARRATLDDAAADGAVRRIAAALLPRGWTQAQHSDDGLDAARQVAEALGATLPTTPTRHGEDALAAALHKARIRVREVRLEPHWWRANPGPLLAWRQDGTAVALLPEGAGRMRLSDPAEGRAVPVDTAVAATLRPMAWMLHRPLPAGAIGARDLLSLAAHGLRADAWRLVLAGVLGALMALGLPLATSLLFGTVLPQGDAQGAVAIVLALAFAAFGALAFEITRSIALLRMQSRIDAGLQAALWDRLLRMPPELFRSCTAGDLVDRANAVGTMRELLTTSATQALMGAVFSLVSLALLFSYSVPLALAGLGLVLVLGLVTLFVIWRQWPHRVAMMAAQGRVEGLVLQLLSGVGKLRVAGAERRGFARWAALFAEQQRRLAATRYWQAGLGAVSGAFPAIAAIALFALAGGEEVLLDSAEFAGFYAAFGQFSTAMLGLVAVAGSFATLPVLFDRMRMLLERPTEADAGAAAPAALTGAVELRHVTFRYAADQPAVIDDLSLDIRAGEFVALVGESGSGKSTLVRLLLGFERPESGGIGYDGQDMAGLDLAALRRQIGVVLQDGQLLPGPLLDNILGGTALPETAAWAAARRAGLEADIRAMPMGMNTVVAEGGGNLSGGQRQRVLIARALVREPRLLIFDEATSALDNRTQAIVNESLERLNVTRIVVAHRLVTVMGAHRILVMDGGRIVESGRFEELMAADGRFAAMARRQMV